MLRALTAICACRCSSNVCALHGQPSAPVVPTYVHEVCGLRVDKCAVIKTSLPPSTQCIQHHRRDWSRTTLTLSAVEVWRTNESSQPISKVKTQDAKYVESDFVVEGWAWDGYNAWWRGVTVQKPRCSFPIILQVINALYFRTCITFNKPSKRVDEVLGSRRCCQSLDDFNTTSNEALEVTKDCSRRILALLFKCQSHRVMFVWAK